MGLTVSNGYVVYQRGAESNSPYWRWVHKKAEANAATLPTQLNYFPRYVELGSVGQTLISLGQQELQNEKQIIYNCLGQQTSRGTTAFVQEFNDLIAQKEELRNAMERLKQFSSKSLRDMSSNKQFSSWFVNHFGKTLSANLNKFLTQLGQNIDDVNFSKYESEIDEIVNRSVDEALDLTLSQGSGAEDSAFYTELQQVIQIFPSFRGEFRQAIYGRLNINNLQNILSNRSIRPGAKRSGIRRLVDSAQGLNLKNKRNTTYFAKSLREAVDVLIDELGTSAQASNGKSISISQPDSKRLFSIEQQIDLSFLDQLDMGDQFDDGQLNEFINKLETYYNQYLNKLDQSLVIYRSLPTSKQFQSALAPYNGASELDDLDSVFSYRMKMDKEKLYKFIEVARNTGSGAYFADKRMEVYVEIKFALMAALADYLLADWDISYSIMGGGEQIQMISLGGKYLPLSAVFMAVGRAFQIASANMEQLASINIYLPGKIKYPDPIQIETPGVEARDIVLAAWEEQAAEAREQATFSIYFRQSFEDIIRSQLTY